ncbi:MAG: DUF523 domain-containing protein [Firmicutes bacterium]|nr:DUF523 domain-containing protein [Bacillota bacterium]
MVARGLALPVCPEQLGGDPTPREPVELSGRSGEDVLDGRGRAVTNTGRDKTDSFIRGAHEVLKIARLVNAEYAILKERSPSCGSGLIYDGTFTGRRCKGHGVTAALLERHGIKVYSEEEDYPFSRRP